MAMILRRPSLLYCRQWSRALPFTTTIKHGSGAWPGPEPEPDSKMSPHERLIQSLRSSLKASDPNTFNNNTRSSERRPPSLFGGFYNGGLSDDPEDRSVLEHLRKCESQYRKWGQAEKAAQIGKEIVQFEAASRQRKALRFGSGGPPSSNSSRPSPIPFGRDIRAESTGVNELIREGYSEEEAINKAAENAAAKSSWVFGSLDPEKRSRWESIRHKVLSGEIDFEQDDMAAKLKPYLLEGVDINDQEVDETDKVGPRKQVQPQERHRIVDELGRAYGTGRRKTSIARVWLTSSKDHNEGIRMTINGRNYLEYFHRIEHRFTLFEPLLVTGAYGQFNIRVTAKGGGLSGQAGAIRLGVARALQNFNPEHRSVLKGGKLLTRDSRMVERKKAGKRKARASFPFVKR